MTSKILLHACCGPCAIMPALRLQDHGFEPVLWFHNPNIQPLAEYLRRREALGECADRLGVQVIYQDQAWNLPEWLAEQLPRAASPQRCEWCCQSRLKVCAAWAKENGYGFFSTTLLYSRYQPHNAIREAGERLGDAKSGFVYEDFRKDWQKGIDLSREWGVYRQPYCGCVFSEAERYSKKLARAMAAHRV